MSTTKLDEAGVAKIKPEYLLVDYKPVVNTEYVSASVKEQLEEASSTTQTSDEPPSKRVKLKGRNKQRPKGNKTDTKKKLCPAIIAERECPFGDSCKFSHDRKAMLAEERDNIGPECYLFQTYGKCPFGITCRFSKNHLTEDLKNIAKEDITTGAYRPKEKTVLNTLSKDLQVKLWKRRYDFSKADQVLDRICPGDTDQRKRKEKPSTKKEDKPTGKSQDSDGIVSGNKTEKTTNLIAEDTEKSSDMASSGAADETDNSAVTLSEPKADTGEKDIVKDETVVAAADNTTAQTVVDNSTNSVAGTAEPGDSHNGSTEAGNKIVDHGQSEGMIRLRPQEKKTIDFRNKLYLAPLTTVGNLPFRRICKRLGADVTCGEMAVCTNLLQGQQSEWALLKRHESEDLFGVQLCGGYPDSMTRCSQLITETMDVDFIDINCGCPIDLIFNRGEGSALMGRQSKFEQIVKGMTSVMDVPLTVKLRTGIYSEKNNAHTLMPKLRDLGVSLTTLHGRSRVQRYTKTADWDYIGQCAAAAWPMPVFGNGDILSYEEVKLRREQSCVSGVMVARGALIKPWIFTEIKEQRHWDISASERFDLLKDYANFGLDHWGSDTKGVENTRRFLLEWLSFLYRYVPVGLLERVPQQINERPPWYKGRNDLETLLASPSCEDWVKISEMLLGPVPDGFRFLPKHKANAYK